MAKSFTFEISALGRPSQAATLWHALRLTGIQDRVRGYGRLLDP